MKYRLKNNEELLAFLHAELLSTNEAAEMLNISKARLGQLVKTQKITPVKEQPKLFLKSIILEKKEELEELRKKYRPYDH